MEDQLLLKNIIIVDNNTKDSALLQTLHSTSYQYSFQVFTSGAVFINFLEKQKESFDSNVLEDYDLIFFNIPLKDFDGFEVLTKIRAICSIPIILTSSENDPSFKEKALSLHITDFIVKPFFIPFLSEKIELYFSHHIFKDTTASSYHNLSNDTFGRIFYKEEPLTLSVHERLLLLCFLKHPGKVFSREDLLTLVWNEKDPLEPRVVDNAIRRLRERLARYHSEVHILAKRGIGYYLE